jgi:predicted aldo/keto reductase-like oxidoreductase
MVLCHSLNNTDEVDILYQGLETPLKKDQNFGTLVALRDFRDGTNLTGMNPGREKLLRHIGFSGHLNSPAMINMIQRDRWEILDGMLVAINPNDKRYLNHQYNVIPVAKAKNLGIIAMKVFADGAMYGKESRWSGTPADVIRTVGTPELPSQPLVEYALTTPGIHTAIIGIGQISDEPLHCQLVQNYYAAQVAPDGMNEQKRLDLEAKTGHVKQGQTNYFQMPKEGLTAPNNLHIAKKDKLQITWDTAYAADAPIATYEVYQNDRLIGSIRHTPQISRDPFLFQANADSGRFKVVTVDTAGNRAASEPIQV